jgi:hypothetical protein
MALTTSSAPASKKTKNSSTMFFHGSSVSKTMDRTMVGFPQSAHFETILNPHSFFRACSAQTTDKIVCQIVSELRQGYTFYA